MQGSDSITRDDNEHYQLARGPPLTESHCHGNLEQPADGDFVVEIMLFERHFYTPEDEAREYEPNDKPDTESHATALSGTVDDAPDRP